MNIENNSLVGLIIASTLVGVGAFFYNPPKQKVYIKQDLSVSDTLITADKSRWYYNSKDSAKRNIKLSFYKDKTVKPYETINLLEPDDFFDVSIPQGKSIVHVSQLGQYPTINKRLIIYKINEVK